MRREVISERRFKAGYILKKEKVYPESYGGDSFEMTSAYTHGGLYIGESKMAYILCKKKGIKPELSAPKHNVCSIGFSQTEQKWYGWSHRAIYGFSVGDEVKEGDCCAVSGWVEDYLEEHPEEDKSLPIGFKAETLEDAKKMAVAFAESVS